MRLVGSQSDPPRPSRETRKQRSSLDDRVSPVFRAPEPERSDRASIAGWLTLVVLVLILGVLAYFIFFDGGDPTVRSGLELRPSGDTGSQSRSVELAARPAPAPAGEALRPKSASVPSASEETPAPAGGLVAPKVPSDSTAVQGLRDPGLSAPPSPRRPSASAGELAGLLAQGEEALGSGDIAAARAYYEAAYDAGSAVAATALGRTYDPLFLSEKETLGLKPDPSKAMQWYRLAIKEGDPIARLRLDALRLWLGQAAEHEAQRPRGDP